MADKKISALTSLAQGDVAASTDVLPIVDTSATETKKITASALVGAGMTAGVTNVDINSGSIDGTTIGANSAAAGTFTNLTASGTVSFSGATVSNGGVVTTIDINGGTIDATSIGASSASTGAFTTLTTSSTVTLNGGTANGVLYLNGSKVATSGSGLVFDGTRLFLGTTAVTTSSSQSGEVYSTGSAGFLFTNSTAANYPVSVKNEGTSGTRRLINFYEGAAGGTARANISFDGSNGIALTVGSGTTTFDSSGNLGIGTSSPAAKLEIYNASVNATFVANTLSTWRVAQIRNDGTANANNAAGIAFVGRTDVQPAGIVGIQSTTGGGVASLAFLTVSSNTTSESMRLDSSGNLGLGVTPSTSWFSSSKAIQIGSAGAPYMGLAQQTTTTCDGYMLWGARLSGDRAFQYTTTGDAVCAYRQNAGTHNWFTAASGTAGNTISFTQAMTLDASGNLGLGATSITALGGGYTTQAVKGDNGAGFRLYEGANERGRFYVSSTAAYLEAISSIPLTFSTNGTERARITAGGYFKASDSGTYVSSTGSYHEFRNTDAAQPILYLTATSGSYTGQTIYINNTRAASSAYKFYSANANAVEQFYVRGDGVLYAQNTTIQSLSDGRLKENVRNATEGLDVVNALRPVRYDWKAGYGNDRKDQLGFIAQEVEVVFPDAVSEWSKAEGDDEPYKTVGPGALIPVLVKAIQELTARVAALESK